MKIIDPCTQCNEPLPTHRWWCQFYSQIGDEMPKANDVQIGGEHYKNVIQHWDWVASNDFDYFQGQITKYVARWKKKGGLQDLLKARHFLDKYIELNSTQERS